ncbi:MAG: hypothetical protein QM778_06530 [Myxococcales bacterium]
MLRSVATWAASLLGVTLLLVLASHAALVHTAWGRERVRRAANRYVSEAMAGELEIEHLDEIDLPHLRARGVTITTADRKPCIRVEALETWLDLAAIWAGTFAWERAEIRGGIVYVTEDGQGRVNMEQTFAAPSPDPQQLEESSEPQRVTDLLDLRTMMTSDMTLVIGGGSLPALRLRDLHGTMRVHVLPSGDTELRFDDYRGDFAQGLPTGRLQFRDVKGHVQTAGKRLLRFRGRGESEGAPVQFALDIHTEPKRQVAIDAHFEERGAEWLSTGAFALWTKLVPGLDLRMHRKPL